jgi:hypothetical protein
MPFHIGQVLESPNAVTATYLPCHLGSYTSVNGSIASRYRMGGHISRIAFIWFDIPRQ